MEIRITKEQVKQIITSLETDGHPGYIGTAIHSLIDDQYTSAYWKDISLKLKMELVRSVLRYVTRNALKGVVEADGLARSCDFAAKVPFSNPYEFDFTLALNKQKIAARVITGTSKVVYKDVRTGNDICMMELPENYLPNLEGQLDIIRQFEDRINNPTGISFDAERPKK